VVGGGLLGEKRASSVIRPCPARGKSAGTVVGQHVALAHVDASHGTAF
jgi:hypothetical protein